MASLTICNATLVLADKLLPDARITCENGLITAIDQASSSRRNLNEIDIGGSYLSPGFVDLHVHGGGGSDFMDGTIASVQQACASHLRHGTTSIFPTTTTGSAEEIHIMLRACREAAQPTIEGIHLYGPYFASNKVGCHSVSGRRDPTCDEYSKYFATGQIKIATCAAELPGSTEFYRLASEHQCLVTCGHSNASWSEMAEAFKAGVRHVDHFWCAMSSVPSLRERFGTPMQASMAEFVLLQTEMSTEVIADGHHLAPELLEFAYRMLGPDRLCLVTDCNRGLDQPPGRYRFGNTQSGTWFESDGAVGRTTNGSLASSIVGMDHMVRHFKKATSASLVEVIKMASLTPASRVGIADRLGSIELGKQANFVVLSPSLEVERVFLNGQEIVTR
jgi:N-acetylglucosamine-6-phosphate deacetylase